MKVRLRYRLILTYVMLAIFIIGIISFMVNVSIRKGFENYIIDKHDKLVSDIINNISHSYSVETGFDINDLEHIGVEAIEKGLIISILSINQETVWSAMEHNAGLCETMINNVKQNMSNLYTNWDGKYTEDAFTLTYNELKIGYLKVGYLGPFYFSEEELYFLNSINKVLIFVGFFSMGLAVVIGIIMASSVTKPIEAVMKYLNNIHAGNSKDKPVNVNSTQELYDLYQSVITLEKRIIVQEDLRKQLTQDMAHELKTPLSSIQGQLEAVIDGIFPLTKERIKSSYEEILRIKSLITEIETLSSIENRNAKLYFEFLDLEALLYDVIASCESKLIEKHMDIYVEHGEHYSSKIYKAFYGDSDKIKQVFINLITNSIKYAGESTRIAIILDRNLNGDYMIHFKDNGQGIQEKHIPFIFERFYRADPSRTGHNGLGIGLALVKSILNKHAGNIQYYNSNHGGAHFIITITANKGRNPSVL